MDGCCPWFCNCSGWQRSCCSTCLVEFEFFLKKKCQTATLVRAYIPTQLQIYPANYQTTRTIWSKIFWLLAKLLGNSKKIFWLLRLRQRQLRLATLRDSPSRTHANYRQRSGARHQLAPKCGKSPSRPTISSTSATRWSLQRSGARQQLRLRSWIRFYDNNSTTSSSTTSRRPRRTR
jgi:hypothetical protein